MRELAAAGVTSEAELSKALNVVRKKHKMTPRKSELLQVSRRRDCHFTDIPSPSTLNHLLKGEGGAAE